MSTFIYTNVSVYSAIRKKKMKKKSLVNQTRLASINNLTMHAIL